MASPHRIEKIVTIIAANIAFVITVAMPLIYFWTASQGLSSRLHELAVRQAEIASKFVYINGKLWQFNLNSLEAQLSEGQTPRDRQYQIRLIKNNRGETLVSTNQALDSPTLSRAAPISNGFMTVGQLIIVESTRDIWLWSAIIVILSSILGVITFITLRILPLRALHETMRQLDRETQERHRAESALNHAQKLKSLGTLAGGMAHNLNNLLLPILALSKLVLKDLPAESSGQKRLERVIDAGRRASDLVTRFTSFARHQETERQITDIHETVHSALDLCKPMTSPNVVFKEFLDRQTGFCFIESEQIQTIVLNLVSNAIDAMDGEPGEIEIKLEKAHVNNAVTTTLQNLKAGPHALLTIADTGHGMDEATAGRIFDPFFTTKEVNKGTGLGLSTVYGSLMQNDGAIRVTSTVDVGTIFEIYLPLLEGATPQAASVRHKTEPA